MLAARPAARRDLLLACAALLLACDSGVGPEPAPGQPTFPLLAVRGMVLRAGEESPLIIRTADGGLVHSDALPASDSLAVEVSDLRVGVVTASRRIVAMGAGTATITVRRGVRVDQDTLVARAWQEADSLVAISVGSMNACGIDGERRVRCWGENWYGQVVPGHPTRGVSFAAARVVATPEPAEAIATAPTFACKLGTSGAVHCWGEDRDRQSLSPGRSGFGTYRHPTGFLTRLTVGADHGCALGDAGEAMCWGSNRGGQLGMPAGDAFGPTRVPGVPPLVRISAGTWYTYGLTAGGEMWCWGSNVARAIDPDISPIARVAPRRVRPTQTFAEVSASITHTCGILSTGRLACWGSSDGGQLLLAQPADGGTDTMTWQRVSAGRERTCGIASDLRAYCAGSNEWGALGRAASAAGSLASLQDRQRGEVAMGGAFRISARWGNHACAIGFGGVPRCWGGNRIVQLASGPFIPDRETGLDLATSPQMARFG